MTITVGAVELNKHISWRGFHNSPGVPGSEASTLGGRTVINRLIGNTTEIVLEAIEEDDIRKGYFLAPTLEALASYRDAGTVVEINYHGVIVNAVITIRGINVEKVLWKSENDDEEKYIGSITFKRV